VKLTGSPDHPGEVRYQAGAVATAVQTTTGLQWDVRRESDGLVRRTERLAQVSHWKTAAGPGRRVTASTALAELTAAVAAAQEGPLFGPDVSNNDWSSVAELESFLSQLQGEGFSWIEAKVSEGDYYEDPYWAPTLAWCQANQFLVIGYHYMTTNDPSTQAQTFAGNGGGTTSMQDFEANSGDIANFWSVVNAFEAAGIQVNLSYIPHWYWQEIGSPDISTVPGLIASDYVSGSGYASSLYPGNGNQDYWFSYGGATPAILQFTDAAVIAGLSVDCNAFQGTIQELQTLLGVAVTQPGPTLADVLAVVQDNQTQLRGPDLNGWPQLNGHTVVDALAEIGQKLGIPGYAPPAAQVSST